MSSPHHLRDLAGCNNRTPGLRASALGQRSESSASRRGSGSAEAMVKAVEGLPEDVIQLQQNEQATYARVIAHAPRCQNHVKPVPFVHDGNHRKSLSTLIPSLHTSRGSLSRGTWRGPIEKARLHLGSRLRGCDLDSRSGIDAGEVANAHQHTYVLRSQPHRRVGALVDAIQEQQPPDCSSQCVNHGRRRADAIALTSRPSKRRLLNGVAVWIVRGDFASPAASSPSTQLTRRFARRRRRSPSPSKSSTP